MAQLSVRYGTALYELVVESGDLDVCLEQAITARDVLDDPKCRRVMAHPHISGPEKRAFLQTAFSGALHPQLTNFLGLLITKNRGDALVSALTAFIELGRRAKGYVEARVTSAAPLREGQVLALQNLLARKSGKQVTVHVEVDPSLVGGFSLCMDGYLADGSVRGRLRDMKNSIIKNSIIKGGEVL